MKQALLASLALFGTSALAQVGSAIVLNQCPYDVYLYNTPSADGGYEESDSIIPSGGSWTQIWTELSNGNGWSIKLSKSTNITSILQYEYTFHNDGNIWYDLSAVNGDPWNGDWGISANGFGCTPKLAAYQNPTDDAHAMQWCPQAASISAILCQSPGSSATSTTAEATSSPVSSSSVSPVVVTPSTSSSPAISTSIATPPSSVPAPSVTLTPVTSISPASTTSTAYAPTYSHSTNSHHGPVQAAYADSSSATPTTLATSTTVPVEEAPGVTVWEVETAVVTAVVTATYTEAPPSRIKRHQHAGHQHVY